MTATLSSTVICKLLDVKHDTFGAFIQKSCRSILLTAPSMPVRATKWLNKLSYKLTVVGFIGVKIY